MAPFVEFGKLLLLLLPLFLAATLVIVVGVVGGVEFLSEMVACGLCVFVLAGDVGVSGVAVSGAPVVCVCDFVADDGLLIMFSQI